MFNTPEGNRLVKFGSFVLVTLMVFLVVQAIYTLRLTSEVGENNMPTNVVTVNGMGEIIAVPDIAMFSFGAQEKAKTVSDAQKLVTDKINKALAILKSAGIDDKDVKTTSYNISPNYVYSQAPCTQFSCPPSRQTIDGYEVSQMIEVKVRDTSKAGTILGSLGSAQVTNVSGLNFTVDEIEKVQAQAQEKAIADAKEKAKVLAKNLGVKLGDVVNFSDGSYYPVYNMAMSAKGGIGGDLAASPEIPTGENKIVSNVSVTYEIE